MPDERVESIRAIASPLDLIVIPRRDESSPPLVAIDDDRTPGMLECRGWSAVQKGARGVAFRAEAGSRSAAIQTAGAFATVVTSNSQLFLAIKPVDGARTDESTVEARLFKQGKRSYSSRSTMPISRATPLLRCPRDRRSPNGSTSRPARSPTSIALRAPRPVVTGLRRGMSWCWSFSGIFSRAWEPRQAPGRTDHARSCRSDEILRCASAIRDVGFDIRQAAFWVLGPNGSGKSTTVKILTGLIQPSKGRIVFDGVPIEQGPDRAQGANRVRPGRGAPLSVPPRV